MRNIQVVVDTTGSFNLQEIEKQLINMQNDQSLQNDKVKVSFYSNGETLNKDLNSLTLPLSEENSKLFGLGDDNFNQVIKSKLESKPDILMFIGEYMDVSIEKSTISNSDTKFVFVHTGNDQFVEQFFLAEVKDLPNVKSTNTTQYTNLNTFVGSDNALGNKIAQLRVINGSLDSDLDFKFKR